MAVITPKKLRNNVIYQIFTRNYKDGTFKAVENDLDRIQALGVDIIYLLPVQPCGEVHRKGSLGSPYAIKDYRAIDPSQGTMEDFISLCDSIHARGMKIMMDVVYNHTSPDSWLSENHPEWFYHKADGSFGNRVGDWWDVIDLDYNNTDLWNYQVETLKMWARYVDGFRCDVAPLLPLDFWKMARLFVEEVRPGCIWMAESVEPAFIRALRQDGISVLSDAELYQAFDILYDYDIFGEETDCLRQNASLDRYLELVNQQEIIYPENYCKLRFLENHDQPRAAALVPDDKVRRNWTAWEYFEKGTTMIYAGQENSAAHHPTLFDMDSVDFEAGADLSGLMARLAEIKKDPLFAEGMFSACAGGINNEVIFAEYHTGNNSACSHHSAIGIFSTSGRSQALKLDLEDGCYRNEITGTEIDVFNKTAAFDGEPVVIFL